MVGDETAVPPVAADETAVSQWRPTKLQRTLGFLGWYASWRIHPWGRYGQLAFQDWLQKPAPFREPTESAPQPAPFRELTESAAESAPEPAPFREPAESAPLPAPFREPAESAPLPAPFREPAESAPEPTPFREPIESAPWYVVEWMAGEMD